MSEAPASTVGFFHSRETFGAVDGPGIRYVLFLQGCPLRCAYCHNPDTWEQSPEKGMTPKEALTDILKYKNFIQSGGVTISGGEPLLQPDFCRELMVLCHREGIHCAVDTSGAVPLSHCRRAIEEADLLLLDIKALDPSLCKQLTGQDNRHALEILRYCQKIGKPVWIRHVLVPGVTLVKEQLEALADFLAGFSCVQQVELLPFHKMGEYKWEALGLESPLKQTSEPTLEQVAQAKALLEQKGLSVH